MRLGVNDVNDGIGGRNASASASIRSRWGGTVTVTVTVGLAECEVARWWRYLLQLCTR